MLFFYHIPIFTCFCFYMSYNIYFSSCVFYYLFQFLYFLCYIFQFLYFLCYIFQFLCFLLFISVPVFPMLYISVPVLFVINTSVPVFPLLYISVPVFPILYISVPGLVNSTSQPATISSQGGTRSPDPPLPPRGIKKPPAALSLSQGHTPSQLSRFEGISSSQVIHARHTSDPDPEIPYTLHRRTPSEPPPRPTPLDNRNTVNIPMKSKNV